MNANDTFGWERLNCQFFAAVCRRVLNEYLKTHGFTEQGAGPIGEITYKRFDVFLEIGYEPETYPNYSPTIVLGIGQRKYGEDGLPCGVPFWYLIPDDLPERKLTYWKFKNEDDLELVLTRVKDTILEHYAKPLWLDLGRLEEIIINFRSR